MKTIYQLGIDYNDHLRSLNYSPKTTRQVRIRLASFSRWLIEMYELKSTGELRLEHMERYHRHLTGTMNRKGLPAKPESINRAITIIRGFLKYLIKHNFIQNRLLDALEYLKESKRLPTGILTHDQVKQLLDSIKTDTAFGYRNRAMFELLYSTGIRASEILRIDVNDIDISNGTALIHGKGDKERMVPVGKTALHYLETFMVGVRPFMIKDMAEKALFLSRDGNRLSYDAYNLVVKNVVSKSGLDEYITSHTFRRSCTTELIRGDANMYHVKELLGHSSLETLKHYARLTITDLKKTHSRCHPRERG